MSIADGYRAHSQRQILEIALLGAEHWIRQTGAKSVVIEEWLDHLWAEVSSGPGWDAWYAARPDIVGVIQGEPIPAEAGEAFRAVGVSDQDLHDVVFAVTDISYGSHFGAMNWAYVDEAIEKLSELLARYELGLPPPTTFVPEGRDQLGGWGTFLSAAAALTDRRSTWAIESLGG